MCPNHRKSTTRFGRRECRETTPGHSPLVSSHHSQEGKERVKGSQGEQGGRDSIFHTPQASAATHIGAHMSAPPGTWRCMTRPTSMTHYHTRLLHNQRAPWFPGTLISTHVTRVDTYRYTRTHRGTHENAHTHTQPITRSESCHGPYPAMPQASALLHADTALPVTLPTGPRVGKEREGMRCWQTGWGALL